MAQAARAIIFNNKGQMLVMHHNAHGKEYYALAGGDVDEHETLQAALAREVKEETGLDIIKAQLVFTEDHPEPYIDQFIFLCETASTNNVAIQEHTEESVANRMGGIVHQPEWVDTAVFGRLSFNTIQLQNAIVDALKNGFPEEPVELS